MLTISRSWDKKYFDGRDYISKNSWTIGDGKGESVTECGWPPEIAGNWPSENGNLGTWAQGWRAWMAL